MTSSQSNPYIGADDTSEAQRLDAQAAGALDELRAALALHPLSPSPRVLELGCGSGVFTRALLAALPDATILATDRDERLLTHASRSLADEVASERLRFERADAASLRYPPRAFDLVTCRCLLMHQPDPLVVVAEMFRVAEVGGVALAVEPDWGARALYPDGEALTALLDLARRARSFGFPDLLLGRKLFALFRAAGFVEVELRASAFLKTARDQSATFVPGEITGPGRLLQQARPLLRGAGLADDAAIDELIARLDVIQHHSEYFSAAMDFTAIARKPAPPLSDTGWQAEPR